MSNELKTIEELERLLPDDFVKEMATEVGPSIEYIADRALWNRQPKENKQEYDWFIFYRDLSLSIWDFDKAYQRAGLLIESEKLSDITLSKFKQLANKHNWQLRRYAHQMYLDWFARQADQQYQLKLLQRFRNVQASITEESALAAQALLKKVTQRIHSFDSDDITVAQLPNFLRAIGDIIEMASDAEARVLSIGALLDLHQDELLSQIFHKHEELKAND